jgi:hypothetical protein
MTLTVDFKWIDAGPSIDRLSATTMAEFALSVNGTRLTSHVDRQTHSHGNEITVPLYPLAEWIASWWWPLFYEYGEWNVEGDADYIERHDMAFAAAGFVYPSMLLQPTGRFMEIRSRGAPRRHSPIEFIAAATAQIPIDDVKGEFAKLIEAVIARLRVNGIVDTTLECDWEAIGRLSSDELAFSKAAGRFGIDPFDMGGDDAAAIERLASVTDGSLVDDLFSLAPPRSAETLLETIHDINRRIELEKSSPLWARLAAATPRFLTPGLPWEDGYSVARWVRGQMNLDGQPLVFDGDSSVAMLDLDSESERLTAVVAATSPSCAVKAGGGRARRFARARAVGNFLMRTTQGPSLLTSMKTDQQARTRAFAAEFLAPADGIRQRLGTQVGQWIGEDTVDALADEFDVSSFVISHQVRNHQLGRIPALTFDRLALDAR